MIHLFILFLIYSPNGHAQETPPHLNNNAIWPIRGQWTKSEEENYSRWLRDEVRENLFKGSGLSVDCADFAVALRWIYAHDRGLPAAATLPDNYLWGSWQSSAEWDQLPTHASWKKDARFKAALRFLFKATYTHSVLTDLYPVQISPEYVTGGTIVLNLWQESGHTRTITRLDRANDCPDRQRKCMHAIAGSEPASQQGFIVTDLPGRSREGQGGLMRFRWPKQNYWGQWQLTPAEDMPGFSREQYEWNEDEFTIKLFIQLGLGKNSTDTYIQLARFLVGQLYGRLQVTSEGFYMCALVRCAPGSELESLYSTPQRDHRLKEHIQTLTRIYAQLNPNTKELRQLREQMDVPLVAGLPLTYLALLDGHNLERLKENPQLDFWERWGERSPQPNERWAAHLQSFQLNWQTRANLVHRAHKACHGPSGKIICNPKSEEIRALNTSRFDQGFRAALTQIQALYRDLPEPQQASVDEDLKRQSLNISLCGPSSQPTACSLYDLLIAEPNHIETMSANPIDSVRARYGF